MRDDKDLRSLKDVKGFGPRLGYIWDYYKLQLFLLFLVIVIPTQAVYRRTHQKEVVLYLAGINVVTGDDLLQGLTDDYLTYLGLSPKTHMVEVYKNLYVTQDQLDPHYGMAYASELKILAAIDDEKLDVVLMTQAVYEAFLGNGYLADMDGLLPQDRKASSESLGDATLVPGALLVNEVPLFARAGYTDPLYLGVVENSSRKEMAATYLAYLLQGASS